MNKPKAAIKEVSKRKPITSADELANVVSYLSYTGERTKEAAEHLQELATMLCEAQDRHDEHYRSNVAQGVQLLVDTIARELESVGDSLIQLGEDGRILRDKIQKGRAA